MNPAERNESPVPETTVKILFLDADGNEVAPLDNDGNEMPAAHVSNVCVLLATASDLLMDLVQVTSPNSPMLGGMVAGLGMTLDSVYNNLMDLQNVVSPA